LFWYKNNKIGVNLWFSVNKNNDYIIARYIQHFKWNNSFYNNAKKKKNEKSYKVFNSFMAKTIWKKNDLEAGTCTKIFGKRLINNIDIDRYQ
jgi:hypothetical protein